jgi:hypothetical protein
MTVSWLKKGAESAAVAKQEQAEAEIRKEEQGKMFRFFVKEGEEAAITFIDGDLSPEGFLLPPRYYEHNLYLNGHWGNFVCPEKTAPHLGEVCPICATGDRPSLVSLFTIIDHREFTGTKDATKKYKDTPKLFVAKTGTMEILNKIALKRGGLAGCTFDVSRTGDKSPAVGSMFDFVKKTPVAELEVLYTREFTDPKTNVKTKKSIFVPANYEVEIVFRTGEQLAQLGFGSSGVSGFNNNTASHSDASNKAAGDGQSMTDYASQL